MVVTILPGEIWVSSIDPVYYLISLYNRQYIYYHRTQDKQYNGFICTIESTNKEYLTTGIPENIIRPTKYNTKPMIKIL